MHIYDIVVTRGCISSFEKFVLRNLMTKNSSRRKQAKKSKNWAVKINIFSHLIVILIEVVGNAVLVICLFLKIEMTIIYSDHLAWKPHYDTINSTCDFNLLVYCIAVCLLWLQPCSLVWRLQPCSLSCTTLDCSLHYTGKDARLQPSYQAARLQPW